MLQKKNFDKVLFLIISTVLFYVGILIISDINLILEKISQIKLEFFLPVFFLMGIQFLFLGVKYHRLLKKLNIPIRTKDSVVIFIAGLSLIATPAGIGTAVKSQVLKKKYGQPFSKTLPLIFVERFTELLAILIILTFFLVWNQMFESLIVIIIGYCFIFGMYSLSSNSKLYTIFKNIFSRIKRINKLLNSLDDSKESLSKLFEFKTISESILWSIPAKVSQFVAVYFIFLSLGVDIDLILSGQIYYTSLVLGSLTFIPSGLIITESSMLAMILNIGVDLSVASLAVILIRLITTWLGTIVGIIALKSTGIAFTRNTDD